MVGVPVRKCGHRLATVRDQSLKLHPPISVDGDSPEHGPQETLQILVGPL